VYKSQEEEDVDVLEEPSGQAPEVEDIPEPYTLGNTV